MKPDSEALCLVMGRWVVQQCPYGYPALSAGNHRCDRAHGRKELVAVEDGYR